MRSGEYYTFEGIVGCGKSTQSKIFYERLKVLYPEREVLWTYEPGDTEIANAIRKVVQGTTFQEEMTPLCEAYLYAAARAQSLPVRVEPVLRKGGVVVSDRSSVTSLDYQGFGRGLTWQKVLKINEEAVGDIKPNRVAFIDSPVKDCLPRAKDKMGDKFELLGEEFFEICRNGYLELARIFPDTIAVVDGQGDIETVAKRVAQALLVVK